jgi:hypothetical protein
VVATFALTQRVVADLGHPVRLARAAGRRRP